MHALDALIPLFGIVFVIGPIAAWAFSYSPLGRAVVNRVNGRSADGKEAAELRADVERLHELLAAQGEHLEDLHERLDFAERLLSSKSPPAVEDGERISTPV